MRRIFHHPRRAVGTACAVADFASDRHGCTVKLPVGIVATPSNLPIVTPSGVRIYLADRHELEHPRPSCWPCTVAWSEERGGIPARVRVERSAIIRDVAARRYVAVVHCHERSEVVDLGEDIPTEQSIASRIAFKGTHHHGKAQSSK